jgi:oxygen-independent coproporphyrinogen III oxidase
MWPYHPELLAQAVPRYTSFPTAAEFTGRVGGAQQADLLANVAGPVSLYAHIPYCEQICWYCGCNTGASGRAQRLTSYLDALCAEIGLVARLTGKRITVDRIALGGGSPNAIPPVAFVRLLDRLMTAFSTREPLISVEIDPRGFTPEWSRTLGATGVSHVSLGVQTFDPAVQAAIGRVQPLAMIERTVDALRSAGVRSLNFDLMYGLPGQGDDALADTLERTVALRPDRIALFGYAHVPHLLPRQRRIDATNLPDQAMRFTMAARGFELLTAAGYVPVGFDHFALPHDGMAIAARAGTLRRNFQGFTDDQAEVLIGLGASAISCFPSLLVQNEKNAGRYRMLSSQACLAGALGVERSADDRLRACIVEDILCGRPAELGGLAEGALLQEALTPFVALALVGLDSGWLVPTQATRPYARSISALFDPYRAQAPSRFSSAV